MTAPISIPFRDSVPTQAVLKVLHDALGDVPGNGWIRLIIEREQHGPGTELKRLLAKFGITASPGCTCNARAAEMDRNGCDWCEANTEAIVGWLREEAGKRGLPFIDAAGRILVRRAIANARRAAHATASAG